MSQSKRHVPTDDELRPPVYEEGSNVGPNISQALELEDLDRDLYRSRQGSLWLPANARGVFGGQVIGQALTAANRTVRDNVRVHSLHSYFLLSGDVTVPIYYFVTRLRDGGSYVTRLVEAKQKGRCIFTMTVSYQVPEPYRPRFAIALPRSAGSSDKVEQPMSLSTLKASEEVSLPSRFSRERAEGNIVEGLPSYEDAPLNEERYLRLLEEMKDHLPEGIKTRLKTWIKDRQDSAIEIRDALPNMYDENGLPMPGYEQAFWMRTRLPVQGGEDAQKAALAYASDLQFLGTVTKALGNSRRIKMMATLDHSIWFYEPFDFHEPMLFFMQAQAASNGRGLVFGRFYKRDGTLVAVLSQEGLVRGKNEGEPARASSSSKGKDEGDGSSSSKAKL